MLIQKKNFLFLNFLLDMTNREGKNLFAAFLHLNAANMQHSAAKIFFRWAPFLDWFVMWNYSYSQIFSLIQPIVEAKTYMQHFDNFMQQMCSIMLQNLFLFAEHSFYIDLSCKIAPIPKFLP